MSIELDCRGLACPAPVLETMKELQKMSAGTLTVLVDNPAARENVSKYATAQGCTVQSTEQNSGQYALTITKGSDGTEVAARQLLPSLNRTMPAPPQEVYLLTSDTLGRGDDTLGGVLVKSCLVCLVERQPRPKALLLLNAGVKLAVLESPVLEHLRRLEQQGTEIIACGTCLDYYGLQDQLAVGSVGNMYSILEMAAGHQTLTL